MPGNPAQPSDNTILNQINQLLHDHAQIDHSKIEVEVKEGSVLLKGKADTEEEKESIQLLCAAVDGVNKVENKLTIDVPVIHAITSFVSQIISGDNPEKKDNNDPEKQ